MMVHPPDPDLGDTGQRTPAPSVVAQRNVLAWLLVAGVAADLAARAGLATIATFLLIGAIAGGLLVSGRVRRPQAVAFVVAAPAFAGWLAVRSSPWLVAPDVLVAVALLGLGARLEQDGNLFDLDVPGWLRRGGSVLAQLAGGGTFAVDTARASVAPGGMRSMRSRRWGPLVRGLVVGVPVVLVLGSLLRSADPVFASFVTVHVNGADLVAHPMLIALGIWAAGGFFRAAAVSATFRVPAGRARLGITEAMVVLILVDVLFGLFALAQLVAVTGGGRHVLRTEGLTYADYARSGYFQLLWAAGLTLVLLILLGTFVERPNQRFGGSFGLAAAVCAALTIVVALVAFRRLSLYEHAFGLTMLRLSCMVFAAWVMAVFVLLAVSLVGAWRRQWFVGASLTAGLVILVGFNAMNPEAAVARRDLQRGSFADVGYLVTLSDDAVPTAFGHTDALAPDDAAAYTATVCPTRDRHHGWASFNLARSRAAQARRTSCSPAGLSRASGGGFRGQDPRIHRQFDDGSG